MSAEPERESEREPDPERVPDPEPEPDPGREREPEPETEPEPPEEDIEGECPHCRGDVVIRRSDIACGIFRHAVFKATGEPIPPHTSKEECESLFREGLVYGCSLPFRYEEAGGYAQSVDSEPKVSGGLFVACDYL
jgi:hypothetical protein